MINQVYTGTPTSRRFVALPVAGAITAGQPLLVGKLPCVTLDSYQSNEGGATCLFGGTFALTVIGASDEASPPTGAAIHVGDKVYASGTLDSTTNVTYGLTINADSSKTLFGNLDPSYQTIASGVTDTNAQVMLPNGA